jgi:hypothetical protein
MGNYNEYVAGWLDSSIHDFLVDFPRNARSASFALITCLDSDMNPKSLLEKSPELRAVLNGVKTVKNGLLVPSTRLQEAKFRDTVFLGFDEIWFFSSDAIEPKPESVSIVGPNRIGERKLDQLVGWMTKNGCSMALGDGDGLNVIVKAHGLVRYLLAHSLSQPEPALHRSELIKEDTGEE